MKKIRSGLLLSAIALVMTFSLTACGLKGIVNRIENGRENAAEKEREESKREPETTKEKETQDTAKVEGTTENKDQTQNRNEGSNQNQGSSQTTGLGLYESMEAYVNSDEVQSVLQSLSSQMSGSGMKIEIRADGDKMVYTYTYENLKKQEGMAESLESAMEAQVGTFQSTANQIKSIVKAQNPSVVIEYVDCNGEMIYSREFVAQ